MKRLAIVILCLFTFATTAFAGDEEDTKAEMIGPAALQTKLESDAAPVVIDVRSKAEFESGHVPGAIHIPHNEIAKRIEEVDAPNGVALYCMKGPRAFKGEETLVESGYDLPLYHLEGGYSAWLKSGLAVEKAE